MEEKELLKLEKENNKLNKLNDKAENKRIKENNKALIKEEKRPIKEKKKNYYRSLNEPPKRNTIEEIGNAVTHGIGALLAIAGAILLLLKSDTGLKITASIVYGFAMFFMMLMSCLYHSFKSGSVVKRIWRRFDYTSIYLLIGGTFAPIYLVYYGNTFGIVMFIIQWVLIATGVTFVCIFGPGRIKWLHFTLYFAIGWSGLIFIPEFIKNNLPLLIMILSGGLVYTFGMIPFAVLRQKSGAHFLWHFFVLAGAIVQFIGILLFIY